MHGVSCVTRLTPSPSPPAILIMINWKNANKQMPNVGIDLHWCHSDTLHATKHRREHLFSIVFITATGGDVFALILDIVRVDSTVVSHSCNYIEKVLHTGARLVCYQVWSPSTPWCGNVLSKFSIKNSMQPTWPPSQHLPERHLQRNKMKRFELFSFLRHKLVFCVMLSALTFWMSASKRFG